MKAQAWYRITGIEIRMPPATASLRKTVKPSAMPDDDKVRAFPDLDQRLL